MYYITSIRMTTYITSGDVHDAGHQGFWDHLSPVEIKAQPSTTWLEAALDK